MPWLLGSMPDSLRDYGYVASPFWARWLLLLTGDSHTYWQNCRGRELERGMSSCMWSSPFPPFPPAPHLVNSFILGSGGGLDHHGIKTKVPGFLG